MWCVQYGNLCLAVRAIWRERMQSTTIDSFLCHLSLRRAVRWNLRGKVPTCHLCLPAPDWRFSTVLGLQHVLSCKFHSALHWGRPSEGCRIPRRLLSRAASESMGIPLPPPWVLLSIMLTFSKNIQDIKAIGSLGWSIVRGRGEVSQS